MKIKIQFIIIITTLFITSCGTSFGKKKEFGNLEVYYSESVPEEYANDIGTYFVNNNLILDKKHSIKLTSNHDSFVLKLILNDKHKALPEKMESDLRALELDIKNSMFKDLNFKIEICDVNFYPLNLKN
jgi:hypothetical protein